MLHRVRREKADLAGSKFGEILVLIAELLNLLAKEDGIEALSA